MYVAISSFFRFAQYSDENHETLNPTRTTCTHRGVCYHVGENLWKRPEVPSVLEHAFIFNVISLQLRGNTFFCCYDESTLCSFDQNFGVLSNTATQSRFYSFRGL